MSKLSDSQLNILLSGGYLPNFAEKGKVSGPGSIPNPPPDNMSAVIISSDVSDTVANVTLLDSSTFSFAINGRSVFVGQLQDIEIVAGSGNTYVVFY